MFQVDIRLTRMQKHASMIAIHAARVSHTPMSDNHPHTPMTALTRPMIALRLNN